MKKILSLLIIGFMATGTSSLADIVYEVPVENTNPTILEKIEDKTQDAAEAIADTTKEAAQKTGKAVKSGAIKAGNATKSGAIKAGKATKKGAKKATNWSATKIRNGANIIIEKTSEQELKSE